MYLRSWAEKQENLKSAKYTEQKKTNEKNHFKAREVEERGKPECLTKAKVPQYHTPSVQKGSPLPQRLTAIRRVGE